MTSTPLPARLYVFLAREAPIAVIFRRGPSEWAQMIKWHTDTDTFEVGQWLHGRIYPEYCDLSPDGQLLVYFAGKFNQKTMRDDKFAWTAISKPPYFTALDIQFSQGTRGGGGVFPDSHRIWFHNRTDQIWCLQTLPISAANPPSPIDQADFPYTYPERMRRHLGGWHEIGHADTSRYPRLIWQRTVNHLSLTYREINTSKKPQSLTVYTLKLDNLDSEINLTGVPWADFDQQGRLVVAKEGRLFSANLQNGDIQLTELADFNANKPDPQPTPDWAQKW